MSNALVKSKECSTGTRSKIEKGQKWFNSKVRSVSRQKRSNVKKVEGIIATAAKVLKIILNITCFSSEVVFGGPTCHRLIETNKYCQVEQFESQSCDKNSLSFSVCKHKYRPAVYPLFFLFPEYTLLAESSPVFVQSEGGVTLIWIFLSPQVLKVSANMMNWIHRTLRGYLLVLGLIENSPPYRKCGRELTVWKFSCEGRQRKLATIVNQSDKGAATRATPFLLFLPRCTTTCLDMWWRESFLRL